MRVSALWQQLQATMALHAPRTAACWRRHTGVARHHRTRSLGVALQLNATSGCLPHTLCTALAVTGGAHSFPCTHASPESAALVVAACGGCAHWPGRILCSAATAHAPSHHIVSRLAASSGSLYLAAALHLVWQPHHLAASPLFCAHIFPLYTARKTRHLRGHQPVRGGCASASRGVSAHSRL